MELSTIQAGLFVALVGTRAVFSFLSVRNVQYADRLISQQREWVESTLGVDDSEELQDYHRLTTGLSELRGWVGLAAVVIGLYAGGLSWAVDLLAATGLSTVGQGILFLIGVVIAAQLFSLPFSLVSTFGIEEVFGFNESTPRLFVRDRLIGLVLSIVLAAVLGGAVLAVIERLPTLWPAAAWGLFVAFSLAMQILYPRVIAPLFNDFEPIEDGEQREAIETVFERAGFETSDIYTMDASRRSTQLNAYFVGFGRTKRVVLFDTLLDRMTTPELQSVLAHELAHWKQAHIWKQFAGSALRMAVVIVALGWLVDFAPLAAAFSVPTGATYGQLTLSLLVVGPLLQLTAPLTNKLSLKHEREADANAAAVMGAEPMIDALGRLAGENLANPFPHPWYAAFHHNHPPIPERIRLLQQRANDEATATSQPPATGDD
mgnify:CR=1 FL=1